MSGRILVGVPVIHAVAEVQNSSTGSQVTPPAELNEMVQYLHNARALLTIFKDFQTSHRIQNIIEQFKCPKFLYMRYNRREYACAVEEI